MSQNLERSLAFFDTNEGNRPADVLQAFRAETGAGLHFRNGTYELTYCGVKGTSTSGSATQLIASWSRAARKRLDARKAAGR